MLINEIQSLLVFAAIVYSIILFILREIHRTAVRNMMFEREVGVLDSDTEREDQPYFVFASMLLYAMILSFTTSGILFIGSYILQTTFYFMQLKLEFVFLFLGLIFTFVIFYFVVKGAEPEEVLQLK